MKMKERLASSQRQSLVGILTVFLVVTFCFLWGKVNVDAEDLDIAVQQYINEKVYDLDDGENTEHTRGDHLKLEVRVDSENIEADSISYQWYREGKEINGAKSAIYEVDKGYGREGYSCTVSYGSLRNTYDFELFPSYTLHKIKFFLVVNGKEYDVNRQSLPEIKEGEKFALKATATSDYVEDSQISYQWYDEDGNKLSEEIGGNTSIVQLSKKTRSEEIYKCEISDGNEVSEYPDNRICIPAEKTLTVVRKINGKEQGSILAMRGESITLEVSANTVYEINGKSEITYQWLDGENQEISGANSSVYKIKKEKEEEQYTCVVSDGNMEKEILFEIGLKYSLRVKPYINDMQVSEFKVRKGKKYKINVKATSIYKQGNITYRWYDGIYDEEEDKEPLCDTNGQQYAESEVIITQSDEKNHYYYVEISDGNESKIQEFSLLCEQENIKKISTKAFINGKNYSGDNLGNGEQILYNVPDNNGTYKLEVKATTTTGKELKYSWTKTVPTEDGEDHYYVDIEGATSSVYEVNTLKEADVYTCKITDGEETKYVTFILNKNAGIELISSSVKQNEAQIKPIENKYYVEAGQEVCLEVSAKNTLSDEALTYTWYDNDEDECINENSNSCNVIVPSTKKKYFYCVVSSGKGSEEVDFSLYANDSFKTYIDNQEKNELQVDTFENLILRVEPQISDNDYIYTWKVMQEGGTFEISGDKNKLTLSKQLLDEINLADDKEMYIYVEVNKTSDKNYEEEYEFTLSLNDYTQDAASYINGKQTSEIECVKGTKLVLGITPKQEKEVLTYEWYNEDGEKQTSSSKNTFEIEKNAGEETYYCVVRNSNCSSKYIFKLKEKQCVHNLVKTEAKAATCTEAGNKAYWTCSTCHKVFSDEHGETETTVADMTIAKKPHTEVDDPAVAPTETTPGKTAGTHCSVCNTVLVAQKEIPATGKKQPSDNTNTPNTPMKPSQPSQGNNGTGSTKAPKKDASLKQGTKVTDKKSKVVYKINGNKTVEYNKVNKKAKTATVPTTVKVNGVNYQVTAIAPKAFANNKNLKKVVIPVSVRSIGKQAFSGCKNLKTIIINTPYLTKKSVGAKAFKGIHTKATIKVPKKQKKAYQKFLKSKGIGKKVKIK